MGGVWRPQLRCVALVGLHLTSDLVDSQHGDHATFTISLAKFAEAAEVADVQQELRMRASGVRDSPTPSPRASRPSSPRG